MDKLIQSINADGYAILNQAVPFSLIERLRNHFARVCLRVPETPDTWKGWLFEEDTEWLEIIQERSILSIAERILGPEPCHLSSHYWVKSPRSVAIVPWHQDAAFFKFRGGGLVTLWIPLDVANRESGCLQVIKGSHKQEIAPMISASGGQLGRRALFDPIQEHIEFLEAIPTDIIILTGEVMHMSGQNTTHHPRRAFSLRVIPDGTEVVKPFGWRRKVNLSLPN